MDPERPDQKETKQISGGEKGNTSLVGKVRETSTALKDRAIEEARPTKIRRILSFEIDLSRLS